MGEVQTTQNAERFELGNRKSSLSKPELDTKIREDNHRLSVSEANPPPSLPGEPSSDNFRSLIATNCSVGNIRLSPPSNPDECLFYVKNGSMRKNIPSVVITHETKEGPVIGTLKLGWYRDNIFGLGDPMKEKDITWENLKRTSDWTHGTYEFSFGEHGERRTYIWQRTHQSFFSDQPDMECREKLMGGGMGETLAIYKGNQGMMLKSRGQFWIAKGLDQGGLGWSGKTGGKWSQFELTILLTGLGIIESSRRRARARRS
ncbi:hypothetical protein MMC16_005914 [Acarospora aff. strigata]|nr:hypothetical protein [Acarospora aff. strigata]